MNKEPNMKSTTSHEDQYAPEPTPQEEEAWREIERRQQPVSGADGLLAYIAKLQEQRSVLERRVAQLEVAQPQPSGNTGEVTAQSREAVLRAMSRNYTSGKHVWDHLDADACAKGAEEIKQLRAALAAQSRGQDREDAERLKLRLETIRQLYPNAPSDAELDAAIDHARRIEE